MDSNIKGLNTKVLREFNLSASDIRRDKTGYICAGPNGAVCVQKSRATGNRIHYAHFVKESLHNHGFSDIDRYILTDKGDPFYELNDEIYTATNVLGGHEIRFDDYHIVSSASRSVGLVHKLAMNPDFFDGYMGQIPFNKEYAAFTTEDGFAKQLKLMSGYKKIAKKQNRLSDFDVLFLRNYDSYVNLITRILELVDGSTGAAINNGVFSHNMLKEETLIANNGCIFITSFDESTGDHWLFDLASIIKRYVRMSPEFSSVGLTAVINAYASQNPLKKSDMQQLYAILLFPDKYYKTCVKYYSKKRKWTPASFDAVLDDLNGEGNSNFRLLCDYFERSIN
jgi:spore coat protein I